MHCVAGLDDLTSGTVRIGEADLTTMNDRQLTRLRRDRVGFIFQAFNLVPTLSALENITLPSDLAGRKPDRAWLDQVIATVGLENRLSHRPSELSGGQQQRVAVARALAGRPEIIFGDEPTGNLDSRSGAEILDFMRMAVRELGQTIVMVTHDPVAASYADRVRLPRRWPHRRRAVPAHHQLGHRPDEELGEIVMFRLTVKGLWAHKLRFAHQPRRRPRRGLHGGDHGPHRHHGQDVRQRLRPGQPGHRCRRPAVADAWRRLGRRPGPHPGRHRRRHPGRRRWRPPRARSRASRSW